MSRMQPLLTVVWHFLKSPRAVAYLAIALLSAGLDMRDDLLFKVGLGECERIDVTMSMLYHRYATLYATLESGFRKPRSHYIRLVVLSPQTTPQEAGDMFAIICKKREYLAGLVRDISTLSPSVISIDLFPQSASCSEDVELQNAIRDVSATIPIVVANRTQTLEELLANNDPHVESLRQAGVSDKDLSLLPHLCLEGATLKYGISRLSCDTRAVPRSWSAYDEKAVLEHSAKPQSMGSLAYVTADTYDSELHKTVEAFQGRHRRAVITFMPEEAFLSIAPAEISACVESKGPDCLQDLRAKFRGKIVLIGELSNSDLHKSVLGNVPGYLLQANYTEGLLDDRYASPLPAWIELILTALGILIIVMIFELCEEWAAVAKPLRVIAGLVLAYCFIILVFVACSAWHLYGGIEADFWAPLVPLPLLELVYTLRVKSRPQNHVTASRKRRRIWS